MIRGEQQPRSGDDSGVYTAIPVAIPYQENMTVWSPEMQKYPPALFQLFGSEYSQVVEVALQPGESLVCEPGSMLHMGPGVESHVDMQSCQQACTRACCANESFFRLVMENVSNTVQSVGLSSPFPSRVVPIDLSRYDGITFTSGAFLAAIGKNCTIEMRWADTIGAGVFGGQGFLLNELHGNGTTWVFLNGGGTVLEKHLAVGEEIVCDTHSVLAFERGMGFGIRMVGGGVLGCCCSQMGLFNSVVRGPGMVLINSMPKSKFLSNIPRSTRGSNDRNDRDMDRNR